jgi:protein TonB
MSKTKHSWNSSHRTSDGFILGVVTALSLTLVAFEWKTPRTEIVIGTSMESDDLPPEMLPIVILKKAEAPVSNPEKRSKSRIRFAEPDPIVVVDPAPGLDPGPGTSTEPDPQPDPRSLMPPEPVNYTPVMWNNVGVRPYFVDCLTRDPGNIEPCTEKRIEDHLQRHFRIPTSIRGHVRTTVTFEIDAQGTIGKIVCAPRVEEIVRIEIERVIRSMPRFVPGSQGGYPVPVYYQIPLSLRTK